MPERGKSFMATEVLKLTAQIVISHASLSELTPKELVDEIKDVYLVLSALEVGEVAAEPAAEVPETDKEAEVVKKPSIPLDEIVKDKYVVCLECGKKMRTLKAHLRKAHKLTPAEYFRCYGLEPKKFPLVCKEYSAQRSKLAKENGLGERGLRRKVAAAS
jgi:predicted transcriptional regulator